MGTQTQAPVLQTTVAMSFRHRGGRAIIVLPNGTRAVGTPAMTIDNTMTKLVARAHRWQQLLLQGVYTSIEEMTAAEAIRNRPVNPSCPSR